MAKDKPDKRFTKGGTDNRLKLTGRISLGYSELGGHRCLELEVRDTRLKDRLLRILLPCNNFVKMCLGDDLQKCLITWSKDYVNDFETQIKQAKELLEQQVVWLFNDDPGRVPTDMRGVEADGTPTGLSGGSYDGPTKSVIADWRDPLGTNKPASSGHTGTGEEDPK